MQRAGQPRAALLLLAESDAARKVSNRYAAFAVSEKRLRIGRTRKESLMALLWILVLALVILAIAGGVAVSSFLWFVLIIALIVAVVAMLSGRGRRTV
jgi:fatty acid desaturase